MICLEVLLEVFILIDLDLLLLLRLLSPPVAFSPDIWLRLLSLSIWVFVDYQ